MAEEPLENTQNTANTQASLEPQASSNRRIAKNTLYLYARMIVMTIIGLYTSRVVLQVLGVSDYGVYNAVGGMVAMLNIITTSMSTAVSRYLTFELGKGQTESLERVFSTSVNVQYGIAIVVFIIGCSVGGWFLNNKMNIPNGRIGAAQYVLICSLFSFVFSIISVPYTASIISHEKMNVFAYMAILEAILKLVVVFLLFVLPIDKLIGYAVLIMCVSIIIRFSYTIYCKRHFSECAYKRIFDKSLLKELTKFAGWTFLANSAWTFNTQGINILINIFFGVSINAARGIASQVESLVMQFVNNFMTALNPQITKSYAAEDLLNMHQLIYRGTKYSFFLMMIITIPFSLETEYILSLWLGVVPNYTIIFVRLSFVASLCTVLGNTLVTAQFATGRIKKYQIVMTLFGIWVFPITWVAFRIGGGPEWAYIVFGGIYFLLLFVRFYMVKDLISLSWKGYYNNVILKILIVGIVAFIPPLMIIMVMPMSITRLICVLFVSVISSLFSIYWFGMLKEERNTVRMLLSHKICEVYKM